MTNKNYNIRTAAIIYSSEKSEQDILSIKSNIVESIFLANENKEIELTKIDDVVESYSKLQFTDSEIYEIISNSKFSFVERFDDNSVSWVKLTEQRFLALNEIPDNYNIEKWIHKYSTISYSGVHDPEKLESLLLKFVYEVLNKNINAFNKVLKPNSAIDQIIIDPNLFSVEER